MRILLILEPDHHALSIARTLVSAAKQLGQNISALIMGEAFDDLAQQAAKIEGIERVFYAPHAIPNLAESATACILALAHDFDVIMAPASTFGKNVLPRVAAKLDVIQVSEVIRIVSNDTFEHPIYAGNAIETLRVLDNIKVLTIRTTAFEPTMGEQSPCAIQRIEDQYEAKGVTFVGIEQHESVRPELTRAERIVSGGRGLQSAAQFKLVEDLADALGAAVGASRAAVDAGFVPNDYQVGQTGKVVAPTLYIAIGISGAVQHLAGMKDAKVIVAINKDPDAPIFQIATYGLVGDLFEIVPKWIELLKEKTC